MSLMFPVYSQAVKKARSLGEEDPDVQGRRYAPSSVPHLQYAPSSVPHLKKTIKGKRLQLSSTKLPEGTKMFANFETNEKVQVTAIGQGGFTFSGTYNVNELTVRITKTNGQKESWNFSSPILSSGEIIEVFRAGGGSDSLTILKVNNK